MLAWDLGDNKERKSFDLIRMHFCVKSIRGQLCWLVLLLTWYKYGSHERSEPQSRKCSLRLACMCDYGALFSLIIDMGGLYQVRQCVFWAGDPGSFKKVDCESHGEQVSKWHFSGISVSVPNPRFPLYLRSFNDGLPSACVSSINSFFPELPVVLVFIIAKGSRLDQ